MEGVALCLQDRDTPSVITSLRAVMPPPPLAGEERKAPSPLFSLRKSRSLRDSKESGIQLAGFWLAGPRKTDEPFCRVPRTFHDKKDAAP